MDGIKGYAYLIVLMSHSVACIFPNMILGNAYMSNSNTEIIIHHSPLTLLMEVTCMGFFLFMWFNIQN